MKYRRLDENGDYTFGNYEWNFLFDNDAVGQAVKTKILLFYQEWWENLSIGIPFFQSIAGKVSNNNLKMTITLLLKDRILEIQEVTSVDNIEIDISNRVLSIVIDLTSIYGGNTVQLGVNYWWLISLPL